MEIEEISKIFLISYKDIPRMIKSLDKCVNHAIMSGLGCSHIYNGLTTDMLYEKIIVFKNRQDILATVREVTQKILTKMDKNYAKILIARYIYNYNAEKISNKFNISIRSVFRYLNKALNEFAYYLRLLGYDDDTWFRGELYLENIYENLAQDKDFCKSVSKPVKNAKIIKECIADKSVKDSNKKIDFPKCDVLFNYQNYIFT